MMSTTEKQINFLNLTTETKKKIINVLPVRLNQTLYFLEKVNPAKKNSRVVLRQGRVRSIHFYMEGVGLDHAQDKDDFYVVVEDEIGINYALHLDSTVFKNKTTAVSQLQLVNIKQSVGIGDDLVTSYASGDDIKVKIPPRIKNAELGERDVSNFDFTKLKQNTDEGIRMKPLQDDDYRFDYYYPMEKANEHNSNYVGQVQTKYKYQKKQRD